MRALPAGIEVRHASAADAAAVLEVVEAGVEGYREWAPPAWEPIPPALERVRHHISDEQRTTVLLAEAGGAPVAVASIALSTGIATDPAPPGTVYLWQLFVRRDWQGSGLAGALHDRIVAEARSRGYERLLLWTPVGAAQARRFYEREGWTPTGKEDPDSKLGLALMQYELLLTQN